MPQQIMLPGPGTTFHPNQHVNLNVGIPVIRLWGDIQSGCTWGSYFYLGAKQVRVVTRKICEPLEEDLFRPIDPESQEKQPVGPEDGTDKHPEELEASFWFSMPSEIGYSEATEATDPTTEIEK